MMTFNIGDIHPNTPHLFADLAELLLLINYRGRSSLHRSDLQVVLLGGAISYEEIDDETEESGATQTSAEKNDRIDGQLDAIMSHLEYRAKALTPYYPFQINGESLVLGEPLSSKQRIYRMLLSCSRLRSFSGNKGIRQRWAASFTELSKIAMTGLLPAHATVRIFDANSQDRRDYYSTDLREALKILGKDLGVMINEVECNKKTPQGDAGLDLVGVVDFADDANTSYAILGQCGAQETEWPKKTLEAHSLKLRHFYHMQFDCPSVMFTPVCYRKTTGEWVDNGSTNGVFLADRSRILKLIELQNKFDEIINLPWFIEFDNEFDQILLDDNIYL